VSYGSHPRSSVHVQPDVVVTAEDSGPSVKAHTHPHLRSGRPFMGGERSLGRNGGADRVAGRLERHKESVPLRSHLDAACSRHRSADHRVVAFHQAPVA